MATKQNADHVELDAFVLAQLSGPDSLKAGELVERGRKAGLLKPRKDSYDSTGTARPLDRSLQRLRKAGKIRFGGQAFGWVLVR